MLHGSIGSASAAAPVDELPTPVAAAPANSMPLPMSARRSMRPLPATSGIGNANFLFMLMFSSVEGLQAVEFQHLSIASMMGASIPMLATQTTRGLSLDRPSCRYESFFRDGAKGPQGFRNRRNYGRNGAVVGRSTRALH